MSLAGIGAAMRAADTAHVDRARNAAAKSQLNAITDAAEADEYARWYLEQAVAAMKARSQQPSAPQPAVPQPAVPPMGAMPRPSTERMSGVQQYADGGLVQPRRFNGIPDATLFDYQELPSSLTGLTEAYRSFHGYADGGAVGDAFSRVLAFASGGRVPKADNAAEERSEGEAPGHDTPAEAAAEGEAIPSRGRLIQGPGTGTSDSIPATIDGGAPAALSNGEYVIPADVVREYGVDFFDKLTHQDERRG